MTAHELVEGLRALNERDHEDHQHALMAAAEERERQERLLARLEPAIKAKVEHPEPPPCIKFGGYPTTEGEPA